ncbi:hypothetical protein P22_1112 [Propionispora sp. 2/2-37]|uniref:aminotransferase class V-fold PLP-dependent enzyme n=1 Tax=Propionispora sp. 2/2-37 TaxID=1677858 RepID=UPI0006BB8264|nr:aminotransferase class V-fold PLP-dependent enzyme [Propionispora sp. 2/2-37]CUH95043.1 hypothetical protein P22_1112 [Propionispora sp. 2/2-37]
MAKDGLTAHFRRLIAGVNVKVPLLNGDYVTSINFDNAATTPPFHAVIKEIQDFSPWYSSVHRGTGYKSVVTSDMYEEGREQIKQFVHADAKRDLVIYTKGTTEAINLLSYILQQQEGQAVILSSEMEHLANDLPWRNKFKLDYVKINQAGELSLEDLACKLERYGGKVKLVAVTGASNVTGFIPPVHKIAGLAHHYGARILVDGAQLVPHSAIDMKPHSSKEHIDYLVFSAHKMYAPFGTGVLIGPRDTFDGYEPMLKGGGAVKLVSREFVDWDDSPYKEEAGTPNPLGVLALLTAIRIIQQIGIEVIYQYEKTVIDYLIAGLACMPGVSLYCHSSPDEDRVSIISIRVEGIEHRLLAKMLSYEAGIAVRSGLFCAHPYVEKLLGFSKQDIEYYHKHHEKTVPGLVRISLGLYNTIQEADLFLDQLWQIINNKKHYKEKYNNLAVEEESIFSVKRQLP